MRTKLPRLTIVVSALVLSACGTQEKALESDKPLLVTIEDLRDYGFALDPWKTNESIHRTRYADGVLAVEYDCETPDTATDANLSISVDAEFHPTERSAIQGHETNRAGVEVGVGGSEVKLKALPSFYRWGDESYVAQMVGPNGPGGMVFTARKGTRTYMFMIAGTYFDDPAEWAALVEPRLRYLETYDATRPEASKPTRGAATVYRSDDSAGAGPKT